MESAWFVVLIIGVLGSIIYSKNKNMVIGDSWSVRHSYGVHDNAIIKCDIPLLFS
jgi:hypothetical protein